MWVRYMTIREIYTEAIKGEYEGLALLIEFLVFEKEVVDFGDQKNTLDHYFKPNNRKRMTELLLEYRGKVEGEFK